METLRRDNLSIPQGSTWAVRWPLVSDGEAPLDTTGWTVKAQIRHTPSSEEVLYEWSTSKGNAHVESAFIELSVPHQDSSLWDWVYSPAVYDAEVTTATGDVIRFVQGQVTVSPEVTR